MNYRDTRQRLRTYFRNYFDINPIDIELDEIIALSVAVNDAKNAEIAERAAAEVIQDERKTP